jgi:hypothetical protein
MMPGLRRGLLAAATTLLVACIDLGGPSQDVVSISNLRLPYPSVVIGDVLRDTLGNPAPLSIVAFGRAGDTLAGQTVSFIAIDSTVKVDPDGIVHGVTRDTLGGRVVGGTGGLQTPAQRIIVTIAPTDVTSGTASTSIQFDATALDTTASTNWSQGLALTVTGASGAAAQGYVVSYALIRSPPPDTPGALTAYIGDDSRHSAADTTDTRGIASRKAVVRLGSVSKALLAGSITDTIIVRAHVKYLGAEIAGSPIDYIIPVSKKP